MRVIAAMLVGPGESWRHLDRVLRCASGWADEILVCMDGVDPDTEDAVKAHASGWHLNRKRLFPTDESAARNLVLSELVDEVADEGEDLIVVLDADEELVTASGRPTRDALVEAAASDRSSWPVLFQHLWTPDGGLMRVDGGWYPGHAVRIYRHRHGARIERREFACAPIPLPIVACCPKQESPFVMKHWGYAYPHDRARKQRWYMSRDGGQFHSLAHLESITKEPSLEAAWTG